MSKTWDELSNDAFKLAEDLYNDMIARGIEIDPKTKSKYEELSKLHQPTVISSVCENPHCNDGITMELYGEKYYCHVCRDKQTDL